MLTTSWSLCRRGEGWQASSYLSLARLVVSKIWSTGQIQSTEPCHLASVAASGCDQTYTGYGMHLWLVHEPD